MLVLHPAVVAIYNFYNLLCKPTILVFVSVDVYGLLVYGLWLMVDG